MKNFAYKVYNDCDPNYVLGYYATMGAAVKALAKMFSDLAPVSYEQLDEGLPETTHTFHYNIDKIELKE